jgi:hypothetical protein
MRRFLPLLLVGLFAVAPESAQRPVALVGPTAINPADSTVIEDATIVWEGEKLVAVGPSAKVAVPPGAAIHKVPDTFVMPGLIDGHVHFFQSGGLYTRPGIIDLRAVRPFSEEVRLVKERLFAGLAGERRSHPARRVPLSVPEAHQIGDSADPRLV